MLIFLAGGLTTASAVTLLPSPAAYLLLLRPKTLRRAAGKPQVGLFRAAEQGNGQKQEPTALIQPCDSA